MLNNLFLGLRSNLSDAKVYKKNEKQKEIIDEVLKQNSINQEKEKKEKYNTENIFKEKNQENLPIQVSEKKENIIKRIINKIKGLFAKTV